MADNQKLKTPAELTLCEMQVSKSRYLFSQSSVILFFATGIVLLLGMVMIFMEGGKHAVPVMGGVLSAKGLDIPYPTVQITFLLDILFPIAFGSGLAVFAVANEMDQNREIVRLILLALLCVVISDFWENSLAFKALNGSEVYPIQWPLTVIKYSSLGFAAVLMSVILQINSMLGSVCQIFLRFGFPLSVAVLVAGIGGRFGSDVVGATFPIGLFLLALYARQQSFAQTE